MFPDNGDAVPKSAGGLSNVGDQSQELYSTNHDGDDDGDDGQDNRIVKDGNRILSQQRARIQRHHQRTVQGVEEGHSGYCDSASTGVSEAVRDS